MRSIGSDFPSVLLQRSNRAKLFGKSVQMYLSIRLLEIMSRYWVIHTNKPPLTLPTTYKNITFIGKRNACISYVGLLIMVTLDSSYRMYFQDLKDVTSMPVLENPESQTKWWVLLEMLIFDTIDTLLWGPRACWDVEDLLPISQYCDCFCNFLYWWCCISRKISELRIAKSWLEPNVWCLSNEGKYLSFCLHILRSKIGHLSFCFTYLMK